MANAFIASVEAGFETVENDVVNAAKTALADVENIVVEDIDPAILQAWTLIKNNGGQLLLSEAAALVSSIATGNWTSIVTTLLANVKAAGATTVTQEETLAASTALQIAQAAQGAIQTAVTGTTAASDTTTGSTASSTIAGANGTD